MLLYSLYSLYRRIPDLGAWGRGECMAECQREIEIERERKRETKERERGRETEYST